MSLVINSPSSQLYYVMESSRIETKRIFVSIFFFGSGNDSIIKKKRIQQKSLHKQDVTISQLRLKAT